ncbi:glycosyltransferase family 2 protein [Alienimonas sp. DA493]|uniref:glycosyltransferase family 2 protein n=1 Tax=Alienimonas sp. DA493 TaxID=3373605 RepID=UPI003754D4D8
MNVAFLIFNRPEVTARVFERIRQARPERLFVVADGPRPNRPGEAERVAAARAATESIDWPCHVVRDYSEVNLGCGKRVSSGITGVFEQVEEAIILEDDCLPHPSFFNYCTALLERYRDDERVMCVSGDNFQNGVERGEPGAGYYFSKYPHIWGWATWRRTWRHYELNIPYWPEIRDRGLLAAACPDPAERAYWSANFDRIYRGELDTWDYSLVLSVWMQGGLTALPNVNLVSNIGFGADATHTQGEASPFEALPTAKVGALTPPRFVIPDVAADEFTAREQYAHSSSQPPSDSGAGLVRGAVRRTRAAWRRLAPPIA